MSAITTAPTVLETRLAALQNGYTPLPIPAGQKGPTLARWQRVAPDAATLRQWSAEHASDTNTGILCGEVIAVDIDVLDAGLASDLEVLASFDFGEGALRRTGKAPKAMLLFRAAEPGMTKLATRSFLLEGQKAQVEVLATGQQFVAFGTHPETRRPYVWADDRSPANVPLAELPPVTLKQLQAFITGADKVLARAGGVPKGAAVTGMAGTADRTPPPSETALAGFIEAAPNTLTNRADWIGFLHGVHGAMGDLRDAGLLTDDGEARIERAVLDWCERYDGPQVDDAGERWAEVKGKPPKGGWNTVLRYGGAMGLDTGPWKLEAAQADFTELPVELTAAVKSPPPRKLPILQMGAFDDMPDPTFTVDGLLPEKSLVAVYGPPKQGKTFLTLSLAMHIAAGQRWFGREVRQGAVVYIAGEGAGGLKHRIRAMRQQHGIPADAPFYVIPRAVNFTDKAAVAEMVQAVSDVAGPVLKLLVIDTLARATPGMDENSAGDMGRVVAQCDGIKETFGCTVLVVHHSVLSCIEI